MSDLYYAPEKSGLTTVGGIEWSDGDYQFNLTVVWKRESDGVFLLGEDAGCSCPSPFEGQQIEDLTELPSPGALEAFKAHCAKRQVHDYDRGPETVALIERMYAAGAR